MLVAQIGRCKADVIFILGTCSGYVALLYGHYQDAGGVEFYGIDLAKRGTQPASVLAALIPRTSLVTASRSLWDPSWRQMFQLRGFCCTLDACRLLNDLTAIPRRKPFVATSTAGPAQNVPNSFRKGKSGWSTVLPRTLNSKCLESYQERHKTIRSPFEGAPKDPFTGTPQGTGLAAHALHLPGAEFGGG